MEPWIKLEAENSIAKTSISTSVKLEIQLRPFNVRQLVLQTYSSQFYAG